MELDELLESLEPRKPGEWELKTTLRRNNYKVRDVSNDSYYWNKDIDLIATNNITNNVSTIEVKWDRRIAETGNFYIEFYNPRSRNSKGWFCFCEADLLAYGDANKKVFYMIRVPELKKYIEENESQLEVKGTWDGSKGYILPMAAATPLIFETIVI